MFVAGFLWGVAFTFILGALFLRNSLIKTYISENGFQKTVLKLSTKAKSMKGWKVSAGACSVPRPRDGSKITVIKLCHAKYGAELMNDPASRKTAAMIPCSMAVYENSEGAVIVSRMNMSLVGSILGGHIGKVFATQVAQEQEKMVEVAIEK